MKTWTREYEHEGHPEWVAFVTFGWVPAPPGQRIRILSVQFGLFVPPEECEALLRAVDDCNRVDNEGSVSALRAEAEADLPF